jgi:hypothetical protein
MTQEKTDFIVYGVWDSTPGVPKHRQQISLQPNDYLVHNDLKSNAQNQPQGDGWVQVPVIRPNRQGPPP